MGRAFRTIEVVPDRCDGCGDCVTACVDAKHLRDRSQSRIQPLAGADSGFFAPAVCLQCGDPACVGVCPSAALTKHADSGVVGWDRERCVDCLVCTLSCAYGGIVFDAVAGHVAKCDQCGGDPACVAACKAGALRFRREGDIYNEVGELEDLFVANSCCQGCNLEIVMRHVLRRVGPNCVLAAPPGCVPGVGTVGVNGRTCTKVPSFHPLLTNTSSMLAGVRRYYKRIGRNVTMLALAGDGGTADVGFQSLSGAAERGEEILYVCIDNEGYMNTGAQRSGTTPFGSWTSTTPVGDSLRGKTRDQKYLPLIMTMHQCEYVATASIAYLHDFYDKLDKARAASDRGFAYLHVFSPCVSGWRFETARTIEVQRLAIESNVFPLWEFEKTTGRIRFTHPVDRPLPVDRYLSTVGKFKHLNADEIAHVQHGVDDRVALLKALSTR